MQNRLDTAREARAVSEQQLTELQAAIATERAARPESVRFYIHTALGLFPLRFSLLFFRPWAMITGSTRGGTGTPRCHDEGASRAASGARRAWRL
jgi:hypothetical protein